MSRAALALATGDELRVQQALDALGLTTLSEDGAVLMKAVAADLDIAACSSTHPCRTANLECPEYCAASPALQRAGRCSTHPGEGWRVRLGCGKKHPRWPAGTPESQGGRFAPSVGSGNTSLSNFPPEDRDNGGSPTDKPPKIPEIEPEPDDRYPLIKAIGSGWPRRRRKRAVEVIKEYLEALELVRWVRAAPYRYYDQLVAYLDGPKTFEELDNNRPGPGYHDHHIAEQTSAARDGFPRSLIDSPNNRVIIPSMKHREITAWYQTPNEKYDGLSPREFLRGKSWDERRSLGVQKLIDFGVLKR